MPTSPVAQGQRHKVEDRGKGVAPLPPANTTSTSDTPLPLPLLVSPVAGLDSGGRIPESRATKHPAGMMINDKVVYIHRSRIFALVQACVHRLCVPSFRDPQPLAYSSPCAPPHKSNSPPVSREMVSCLFDFVSLPYSN